MKWRWSKPQYLAPKYREVKYKVQKMEILKKSTGITFYVLEVQYVSVLSCIPSMRICETVIFYDLQNQRVDSIISLHIKVSFVRWM